MWHGTFPAGDGERSVECSIGFAERERRLLYQLLPDAPPALAVELVFVGTTYHMPPMP